MLGTNIKRILIIIAGIILWWLLLPVDEVGGATTLPSDIDDGLVRIVLNTSAQSPFDKEPEHIEPVFSGFSYGDCLYKLVNAESGWKPLAQNPTSTAFGLFQFLDATWAGTGIEKSTDPAIQMKAGLIYIENRYGTACNAWKFFQINRWY